MTVWVLILMVSSSNGVAVTTHEFTTRDYCEAAGKAATSVQSWAVNVRYACAEKGKQ